MRPFKPTQLSSGGRIDRHRHDVPYATVLLSGAYEEAGDAGRVTASAGEVLLHAPFSCHLNRISGQRTRVIDLPLPFDGCRRPSRAHIADPDAVVRLSERDPPAAVACLIEQIVPMEIASESPADRLALALRGGSPPAIGGWARREGVSREHISRRFRAAYGVTAATYRAENQAREAWFAIVNSAESLAMIAAEAGFADQAHMNRAVLRLTGRTPGQWRRWGAASRPQPD